MFPAALTAETPRRDILLWFMESSLSATTAARYASGLDKIYAWACEHEHEGPLHPETLEDALRHPFAAELPAYAIAAGRSWIRLYMAEESGAEKSSSAVLPDAWTPEVCAALVKLRRLEPRTTWAALFALRDEDLRVLRPPSKRSQGLYGLRLPGQKVSERPPVREALRALLDALGLAEPPPGAPLLVPLPPGVTWRRAMEVVKVKASQAAP